MSKEAADAVLELLRNGDAQAFIELAENSIHPGITLVALAKKAERPPTEGSSQPTEEELVLLGTNFHLSRRMIDVACHVAMNPQIEEKFQELAGMIRDARIKEKARNEAELIRVMTRTKMNKKKLN